MWIHSDELTPDLLGLACLLLPGCFLLLGPATLCVLGIGGIPPNRMRQGTAHTLPFVGWVSRLATECQAGLVLENEPMLVQSGCGSPLGDFQFSSLMLRLSPDGFTSDSLAERCKKGKAAWTVSIPHPHRPAHIPSLQVLSFLLPGGHPAGATVQQFFSRPGPLPAELCSVMLPCLRPRPRALLLTFAGDTERKCKSETHKGCAPGWYLGRELQKGRKG